MIRTLQKKNSDLQERFNEKKSNYRHEQRLTVAPFHKSMKPVPVLSQVNPFPQTPTFP